MGNKSLLETIIASNTTTPSLVRAQVVAVDGGRITVEFSNSEFDCQLLDTGGPPLALIPGNEVLVLPTGHSGVILGRIGVESDAAVESHCPDAIVIEARDNLTLKCGDGSITIRKDGKILLKGKDLVSRAQQSNRIKGGSVSIN